MSEAGTGKLGSKLTYQQFWGSSERHDLLPPRKVTVREVGDRDAIAFTVDVDLQKLTDILSFEGVTGGRAVNIVLNYERPFTKEEARLRSPETSIIFGSYEEVGSHAVELSLNVGTMYDLALESHPTSPDKLQKIFEAMLLDVMSHEVGHAREPKGTQTVSHNMALKIRAGAFVLIDAGRRIQAPWLGILEPFALYVEAKAAGRVANLVQKMSPSERFAREYQSTAVSAWTDVIHVRQRSKEQLQRELRSVK